MNREADNVKAILELISYREYVYLIKLIGPRLTGYNAISAIKAFLQKLSKPQNPEAINELGLTFRGEDGKLLSLAEINLCLKEATKNLTEEQRLSKLAAIFGNEAVLVATVLIENAGAKK